MSAAPAGMATWRAPGVLACVLALSASAWAQPSQQAEAPQPKYPEGEEAGRAYDFTHPTEPWRRDHGTEGWRQPDQLLEINHFFIVWWETANKKIPRFFPQHTRLRELHGPFNRGNWGSAESNKIRLEAVRGEKVSFQVAISRRREQNVQLRRFWVPELTGPNESVIEPSRVAVNQVGFVNKVHPDPLYPMPSGTPEWQDMAYGENAIFWITVDVPRDIEPGTYEGAVRAYIRPLYGSGSIGGDYDFDIELEVSPVVLPKRTHLDTINVRLGTGGMPKYARASADPAGYVEQFFEILAYNRMSADKPWPLFNQIGIDFDPFSEEGAERLEKWCRWWADQGLYIGALPRVPVRSHGSVDEAVALWDRHIGEMVRRNGWEERCHTLVDDMNLEQAKRVAELLPDIRFAHHSSGEGWSAFKAWYAQDDEALEAEWLDKWSRWKPVLDIWNERPRLTYKTIPQIREHFDSVREEGDQLAYYWHSVSPVSTAALPLRDFMWRMFRDGATGTIFWGALMWDAGRYVAEQPYPRGWKDRRVWRVPNGFAAPRIAGADVGNGLLMWPGREGPLSSMRLEIYRDGVEDFDLLVKLREATRELERLGSHEALVRRAREALEIPEDFLTDSQKIYPVNRPYRDLPDQPSIPHQKRFEEHRRDVVQTLEKVQQALGVLPE